MAAAVTAMLEAPTLGDLTDDQLAAAWQASDVDDPAVFAAFTAEFDQRDAANRMARARGTLDTIRHEAACAVHAQFLAASEFCRGRLLSREGVAAGIAERDLWTLPEDRAKRYASEELNDLWFFSSPRITVASYVRQRAAEARAERVAALDRNGGNHDHDSRTRAGLAGHDTSPLRPDQTATQTPAAGPGRTVDRCGSHPFGAGNQDRNETSSSDGGAGGTVPPVIREDGDMNGDDSQRKAPTFDEIPDQDDSTGTSGTRAVTFDQVEEIDQDWLWPGMIPAGLLTVIFGPPKASKTTLVIDYAARISRGDVNPDGTSLGVAAPVLMGALEDISESSTVKKLKAAKADLSMVVDISGGPDGDGLELELDHVAWLHEVAAEHPGVAMIVIDTLSNSANKSITTRPGLKAMLKPLAALAANTGAAVILTCHSLKGHDDIPEGGRSLVSIPRMVLQISKSQQEPGVRTLSVHASNVASDSGEGYRYKVIEDGPASRLEWCWDAVRTGPGPEATGQARILLLLRNSEEPLSAQLIGAKTGINYAVTRVLLSRMKKRGEVTPGEERGTWTVPAEPPQLQAV